MTERITFEPLLIRASAGTGKTFALSSRYIKLLAAGEEPDKILATTFTRKAAGEIQTRVFQRLAAAASGEKAAAELAKAMKMQDFKTTDALRILVDLIKNQHRLNICTLDSFFFKIASSFSLELGLMPGWTMADSSENQELIDDVVKEICRTNTGENLLPLMNLLNQGNWRRPVQTRITDEALSLYDLFRSTEDSAWLWLNPEKAPDKKTVEASLGALHEMVKNGASKKIPEKMLPTIPKSLAAFEVGDFETFLCSGLPPKVAGDGTYYKKQIPEDLSAPLKILIRYAKTRLIARLSSQNRGSYELLKIFHTEYEKLRAASKSLSFSDVKFKLSKALFNGSDGLSEVYYRLDSSLKHLLLDEFQDTSAAEWFVIKPLSDEVLSTLPDEHSFFCVGDVKQAIYGWRGGRSEIFDHLEQSYSLKPTLTDTSYRSSQPVIDTVNQVFAHIDQNPALDKYQAAAAEWRKGFSEHKTVKTNMPGYCCLEAVSVDEESSSAQALISVSKRAALLTKELTTKAPDLQIGILCRKNSTVARIRYELTREEIDVPSSEEGGTKLSDSPAVTMFLSLFRMTDHPGDKISRFHMSISPLGDVLDFKNYDDDKAAVKLSLNMKADLVSQGYGASVLKLTKKVMNLCSLRDQRRLMQLVELAHTFDESPSLRATSFIDFVESTKVEDPSRSNVRVMTVHQSKGLEFDICILPELDFEVPSRVQPAVLTWHSDGELAPSLVSRTSNGDIRALEKKLEDMYVQVRSAEVKESLSLLYVALTRARNANYILVREGGKKVLSWASIIRSALGEEESNIKFETGDKNWLSKFSLTECKKKEPSVSHKPVTLKDSKVPALREYPRKSPSALEGDAVFDTKRLFTIHGKGAREKGTLTHAFFATLKWADKHELTADCLVSIAHKTGIRDEKLIKQAVTLFSDSLKKPEIFKALSEPAEKTEIETELPFAFIEDNSILQGTFDRIHITGNRESPHHVTVLDFKTDKVESSSDITARVEFYRPQMLAYMKAASKLFKLTEDKVSARLLFVTPGVVVDLQCRDK